MSKPSTKLAVFTALSVIACSMGLAPCRDSFSTGATAKKPHDPERLQKAIEKRARKAAQKGTP